MLKKKEESEESEYSLKEDNRFMSVPIQKNKTNKRVKLGEVKMGNGVTMVIVMTIRNPKPMQLKPDLKHEIKPIDIHSQFLIHILRINFRCCGVMTGRG